MLKNLTRFGKNFVRENFLERTLDFNGILTKKRVFDKKVAKSIFYKAPFIFYTWPAPQDAERTFQVFDVKD